MWNYQGVWYIIEQCAQYCMDTSQTGVMDAAAKSVHFLPSMPPDNEASNNFRAELQDCFCLLWSIWGIKEPACQMEQCVLKTYSH